MVLRPEVRQPVPLRAIGPVLMTGLSLFSHGLHRPRQPCAPYPDGHRLPLAHPQLADRDVGPIACDAARGDAVNRLPVLEVHTVELPGSRSIASLGPLDPRRVRRALRYHDRLPAWIFVNEHRGYIRRIAWPDQRTCPASFPSSVFSSRDVLFQALAPTLIIVRAGLKSAGPHSSWSAAKGSINNPYYPSPPPRPSIRDMESGISEDDDPMVVDIRKATEIRLGDMKPVRSALVIRSSFDLTCHNFSIL